MLTKISFNKSTMISAIFLIFANLYLILNSKLDILLDFKLFLVAISIVLCIFSQDIVSYFKLSEFKLSHKLMVLLGAFYLAFSICGNYLFVFPILDSKLATLATYLIVSGISILIVGLVLMLMNRFSDYIENRRKSFNQTSNSAIYNYLTFFLVSLGIGLVYLFAFNPAIMSFDSIDQYSQALGLKQINNWHPAFHTILMRLVLSIAETPTAIAFAQIVFLSLILASAHKSILDYYCDRKVLIFFAILVVAIPTNGIYVVTLWKDIPYAISMLWITVLLYKFINSSKSSLGIWYYLQVSISLVLVYLLRHNGVIVYYASIISFIILFLRNNLKKQLLYLVLSGVMILTIIGPVYDHYKVERFLSPTHKYYGMLHDLENIYYWGGNLSDESKKLIEKTIRLEEHTQAKKQNPKDYIYGYYWTNSSFYNEEELAKIGVKEFLTTYIDTFLRNPKMMVDAQLCRTDMIWNIYEGRYGMIPGVTNYTYSYVAADFPTFESLDIKERIPNQINSTLKSISNSTHENSLLRIIFWRFGIWTALLLLCIIFVVINGKNRLLVIFIPLLANIASLVIGNGWQDYRYAWSILLITPFVILWSLVAPKRFDEFNSSSKHK